MKKQQQQQNVVQGATGLFFRGVAKIEPVTASSTVCFRSQVTAQHPRVLQRLTDFLAHSVAGGGPASKIKDQQRAGFFFSTSFSGSSKNPAGLITCFC